MEGKNGVVQNASSLGKRCIGQHNVHVINEMGSGGQIFRSTFVSHFGKQLKLTQINNFVCFSKIIP